MTTLNQKPQQPDTSLDPSTPFKLWFKAVMTSCFFLAALFQTCQFLSRYNNSPINSVFSTQRLRIYPSVTLCPKTWINFTHAEWMLKNRYGLQEETIAEELVASDLLFNGNFTLWETLGRLGVNVREFAEETAVVIYGSEQQATRQDSAIMSSCRFSTTAKDFRCQLPLPLTKQMENHGRMTVGMNGEGKPWRFPMVRVGRESNWTTSVTFMGNMVQYCSTMDPRAGSESYSGTLDNRIIMRFQVPHREYFQVENELLQQQLVKKYRLSRPPSFDIGIHPREARVPRFASLFEKVLEWQNLKGGRFKRLRAQAELYTFMDTPDDRCDPEHDRAFAQHHWDMCVERNFLPCSFSEYIDENNMLSSDSPYSTSSAQPSRLCQAPAEFAEFFGRLRALHEDEKLRDAVLEKCLQPCTQLRFGTDISADEIDLFADDPGDGDEEPISAFLNGTSRSTVNVHPKTYFVRVIVQEPAYTTSQFLGELGGTWGLFLGFSLVTLLDIAEKMASAVVSLYCTWE